MKIYTKTGDDGTSALASGERVSKTDVRLEAYGTVDELNAFVGLLRCHLTEAPQMVEQVDWIQNKLFNIGAALAGAAGQWIMPADVQQLEQWIDAIQTDLPPTHGFVLPGGCESVAWSHVCRTVTRRLERQVVGWYAQTDKKSDEICKFINRLSDFWFVFGQKCGKNAGISFFLWKK